MQVKENRRWIVFGAAGFIGQNLCEYLINNNQEVIAFDKKKPINVKLNKCEWITGNFFEREDQKKALIKAGYVVHLINTVTPSSSNDNISKDINENLLSTIQLLELCIEMKIKKFLTISSGGTVYGNYSLLPHTEEDMCDPICSYGIVKLAIENYLRMYRSLGLLDSVILRVSNPFGPHQIFNGQGLIASSFEKIFTGKPVEIWGDGSIVKDYVHVNDVVRAIFLSMLTDLNNSNNLYNIGSGIGRSTIEVINTIKLIHGNFEIIYKTKKSTDVSINILNIDKAKINFNWLPLMEWKSSMLDTYTWAKNYYQS